MTIFAYSSTYYLFSGSSKQQEISEGSTFHSSMAHTFDDKAALKVASSEVDLAERSPFNS